jgi:hypothetical protein
MRIINNMQSGTLIQAATHCTNEGTLDGSFTLLKTLCGCDLEQHIVHVLVLRI